MPGTVLLLAASPAGKGCLVDAASVLPVLAAVPPGVLAGTDTANVVELADPLEPQAVLTRLRAAAAAPGPLTVFITGQLQLDRRQRLVHLALARTTPSTVRYTALPWHWVREELRLRPPGTTALVLDLHADAETWELLRTGPLDCGRNSAVYGRIAPPPGRRTVAVPSYMKAVATILRSGRRPALGELHQRALARVGSEGFADVVLAPAAPALPVPGGPAPRPPHRPEGPGPQTPDRLNGADRRRDADAHTAITAAVQSGRHTDADALAARHEQAALHTHGAGSPEALHWAEVRADLAMFAGDAVRSCRAWLSVASARLAAGQSAADPDVESAVDRAHHQWGRIGDPARARELGPALAELRTRVPGRRQGALDHVQQQLQRLSS
ncbi:hypothetical protein [Streptomyces sp. P17]|uniref:hypothetical protein n=1 Tax=Streptomyces sp. P17 TaxID=3074716 RepID=UPI0028F4379D|nr:hypothetical protein [Streptomyces sp. P17]MDT9698548.1 hypothetical protein [Streptomyces sp. P17]